MTHIQRGHVRLDLEPDGGTDPPERYRLIRGGDLAGAAWTPDGVNWFATLRGHATLRWIGDSAHDVVSELAYFLLDEERREAHGGKP